MKELDGQVIVVMVIDALDRLEERISELVSSGYGPSCVTARQIPLLRRAFYALESRLVSRLSTLRRKS